MQRLSGLGRRALTGGVYAAVVVGALVWGTLPAAILLSALSAAAIREYFLIRRAGGAQGVVVIGAVLTAALVLAAAMGPTAVFGAVIACLLLLMLRHTFLLRVRTDETAEILLGVLYLGLGLGHLVLIRGMELGLAASLVLVASVWAADVAAYLFGLLFGRHKMSPRISPKKSWEGFVAGCLACVAVWLFAAPAVGIALPIALLGATGSAVALTSVMGDLFESRLKREVGVKDSGTALPGHGGFMDRVDSLVPSAAVAYWLLVAGGLS